MFNSWKGFGGTKNGENGRTLFVAKNGIYLKTFFTAMKSVNLGGKS